MSVCRLLYFGWFFQIVGLSLVIKYCFLRCALLMSPCAASIPSLERPPHVRASMLPLAVVLRAVACLLRIRVCHAARAPCRFERFVGLRLAINCQFLPSALLMSVRAASIPLLEQQALLHAVVLRVVACLRIRVRHESRTRPPPLLLCVRRYRHRPVTSQMLWEDLT